MYATHPYPYASSPGHVTSKDLQNVSAKPAAGASPSHLKDNIGQVSTKLIKAFAPAYTGHHIYPVSQVPSSVSYMMRHVIFIGETGSGKSSIINLIAGRPCTSVSPSSSPCTDQFSHYDVTIGRTSYRLWDTPGLNLPSGAKDRRRSLTRFLQEKYSNNHLDLLVLCIKGNRVSKVTSQMYATFCHASREFGIPVVIAKTHLEKEMPSMEEWWRRNELNLRELRVDGHACLTSLSQPASAAERQLVKDSQQCIHTLISRGYTLPILSLPPGRKYLDKSEQSCVIC